MLFSILRSTEPYLDVYFSEANNIDAELLEAGFSLVSDSAAAIPRSSVFRHCVISGASIAKGDDMFQP